MPFKLDPATINALTNFLKALDKYRFGAVMFFVVMVATGALMAIPFLPAVLA